MMRLGLALIASLLLCTPAAAAQRAAASAPEAPPTAGRLSAEDLDRSLALGRQYLLNVQQPNGSFAYEFDAVAGAELRTRHAVREMGGLWAVATIHRQAPAPETAAAILKALKHYDGLARHTPSGGRYLCEPGAREGVTNTVALYALALQDFLGADFELPPAVRARHERDLAGTIRFLVSLRMGGGRFYSGYWCRDGRGVGTPGPYSDGETLLAIVRAAKADGADPALRDVALESAAIMYAMYVRSALQDDPHSDLTKGFYQWGSLAFYELYTSGWPHTGPYAARTIALARWVLDVHKVLDRSHNAGYAFEGLAVAWELARLTGDRTNQDYIAAAIDKGLAKLLTWQVGSPMAGDAVPPTFRKSKRAIGGVVSAPGDSRLRIDTTQHQMHATLLVRWLMFRRDEE
jgi:UDP-N-acetylmuramoyl-tripeptide--D-alanyl-D-alanine ligase